MSGQTLQIIGARLVTGERYTTGGLVVTCKSEELFALGDVFIPAGINTPCRDFQVISIDVNNITLELKYTLIDISINQYTRFPLDIRKVLWEHITRVTDHQELQKLSKVRAQT